jgi:hypothetical protein
MHCELHAAARCTMQNNLCLLPCCFAVLLAGWLAGWLACLPHGMQMPFQHA